MLNDLNYWLVKYLDAQNNAFSFGTGNENIEKIPTMIHATTSIYGHKAVYY